MSTSRQLGWAAVGTMAAAAAGAAWGWFGNSYESADSAIGTAVLCAVPGALISAVVITIVRRKQAGPK